MANGPVVGPATSPIHSAVPRLRDYTVYTPGGSRTPCAFFLTDLCYTLDEHGNSSKIPAWPYILEDAQAFQDGVDRHVEKTRQMMISWLTAAEHLWGVMFIHGYAGFLASCKEKLVDDGGENSTPNSLMGRIRYIYDRLPDEIRDWAPLSFSHLRIHCPAQSSFIVGEGTSPNMGRGGTWTRTELAKGDPAAWPRGGASEVAIGTVRGKRFFVTDEPFHGNQVVVYTQAPDGTWPRNVIDSEINNAHSLALIDVDGDGTSEIVSGGTRGAAGAARGTKPGVFFYRAADPAAQKWERMVLDPNIASNSCVVADINGDRRPDVACIDDSLKWYENAR